MQHSGEVYINPLTDLFDQLREYETSVNAYRDIENAVETAKKIGKEEGRKKGISEGEKKANLATAKNLKSMGLSVEDIAKATGLSVEEVSDI